MISYSDALNKISPCGISCEACFAYKNGEIKHHSQSLVERLGNFEKHAQRFSELLNEPVFNIYPYFKTQLEYFAEVSCCGCRKENCKLFKSCKVRSCSEKKKVDFCFQCPDFPCRNTGFDENLYTRWEQNNTRMREIGVEAFYQETKDLPRYR